jgi:nifR3 family TIM-barrel protein
MNEGGEIPLQTFTRVERGRPAIRIVHQPVDHVLSVPIEVEVSVAKHRLRALYAQKPVVLAPMEDVSDIVFRRICRRYGASMTTTEFVNVEGLLRGCRNARRKLELYDDDTLTSIQIYGSCPDRLVEAARVAESASPLAIDINCGCWVPKIARRGAGAGWLRDPDAMVAMARKVVSAVSLPVTVKTRVGVGPERDMPIVDLAQRLEDAGVAAITIHCRTAEMGYTGTADWSWAARARSAVSIPVIVNGDIRSAGDAKRALEETGCCGVMIGRRAIDHPWIFAETRSVLDKGVELDPPTPEQRILLCEEHLRANAERRGELFGVHCTRRHFAGYLKGMAGASALRQALNRCETLVGCLEILEGARRRAAAAAE